MVYLDAYDECRLRRADLRRCGTGIVDTAYGDVLQRFHLFSVPVHRRKGLHGLRLDRACAGAPVLGCVEDHELAVSLRDPDTLVDIFAFYPTVRKSFWKPYEESLFLWASSACKYVFLLFALDVFSFITAFYPACLVALNAGFVSFVVIRRRQKR